MQVQNNFLVFRKSEAKGWETEKSIWPNKIKKRFRHRLCSSKHKIEENGIDWGKPSLDD